MASLARAHRLHVDIGAPASQKRVPFASDQTCPLCGSTAQASEGIAEKQLSLLRCSRCRVFVIEKQVLDVIMNARAWNLRPVLRHVEFLSRAARSAAAQGAVLAVTSTNWMRVAIERQRIEEPAPPAGDPHRLIHETPASL